MTDGDNVDDSDTHTHNTEDVFPPDVVSLNVLHDIFEFFPPDHDGTALNFSLSGPFLQPSSLNDGDTTHNTSFEPSTEETPRQLLLPLPQTEGWSSDTQVPSSPAIDSAALGTSQPVADDRQLDLYDLTKAYLLNLNTELQHSSTPVFPQDVPEGGEPDEGGAQLSNWTHYPVPGLSPWYEAPGQGLGVPSSMDAAFAYGDPSASVEIQDAPHEGGFTDAIGFVAVPGMATEPQASVQAHPSVLADTTLSSSIPIHSIDPQSADTGLDPPQGPAFRGDVGSHAVTEASERRRIYPPRFACLVDRCNRRFTSRPNAERHVLAHFCIKPHLCPCGAAFTSKSDLRRHLRGAEHTLTRESKAESERLYRMYSERYARYIGSS